MELDIYCMFMVDFGCLLENYSFYIGGCNRWKWNCICYFGIYLIGYGVIVWCYRNLYWDKKWRNGRYWI